MFRLTLCIAFRRWRMTNTASYASNLVVVKLLLLIEAYVKNLKGLCVSLVMKQSVCHAVCSLTHSQSVRS